MAQEGVGLGAGQVEDGALQAVEVRKEVVLAPHVRLELLKPVPVHAEPARREEDARGGDGDDGDARGGRHDLGQGAAEGVAGQHHLPPLGARGLHGGHEAVRVHEGVVAVVVPVRPVGWVGAEPAGAAVAEEEALGEDGEVEEVGRPDGGDPAEERGDLVGIRWWWCWCQSGM